MLYPLLGHLSYLLVSLILIYCGSSDNQGNNFGRGWRIAPTRAGAEVYTMLYIVLCLEYIAKQATCVLTPHVNAVSGVT